MKGHKNLCKFSISENCFSSSLHRASSFTAAAVMIILRWRMGWKLTFHCRENDISNSRLTRQCGIGGWMSADWSHDEMTSQILQLMIHENEISKTEFKSCWWFLLFLQKKERRRDLIWASIKSIRTFLLLLPSPHKHFN